jgi:serine/threonine-protein kinase HipA
VTSRGQTFVFIQLPDTRERVICGRYALDEAHGELLGRFVYGRSYLERRNAVPVDPVNLPLRDSEFTTARIGGIFGALRDTAPDAWGRMIIERRDLRRSLTELDYLLGASSVRVGGLSYGPEREVPRNEASRIPSEAGLAKAAQFADAVQGEVEGEANPFGAEMDELMNPSSGLGGARPKTAVLADDGQLWVAKFPARGDRWSNAITEAAWLSLAGACGIRVPRTRIVEAGRGKSVLVERFDQEPVEGGEIRRLYLSAHTLLGLDEEIVTRTGWSYLELAQLLRRVSEKPDADVRELYTRMVFNALVSNGDDHPRNHAVIGTDRGGWRLSPAYDLVPSTDRSLGDRRLAMACGVLSGRERWANRHNLISGAGYFGLSDEEADREITRVKAVVVRDWERCMRTQGGAEQDCVNVAHAVAYEGFEYESGGE